MTTFTRDEVLKKIKSLPVDLKTAIESRELVMKLRDITKNQSLHVDDAGIVADLVELTLSGVILTKEFVALMGEALPNMPREKLLALAEEINRRIFAPFRESLKKVEADALERGTSESILIGEHAEPLNQARVQEPVPTAPVAQIKPVLLSQARAETIETLKTSVPTVTTHDTKDLSHENRDSRLKMIPEDAKVRISSDPYKEPLE